MDAAEAFELLGLAPTRDREAILAAWRAARSRFHPDRDGTPAEFQRGVAAYEACLTYADEEVPCPTCAGTGTIRVARGFRSAWLTCAACEGMGRESKQLS